MYVTHDKSKNYPQLIFISDCYKYTHSAMYRDDVEEVYSLLYCRQPRMDVSALNGHIVAFGMRQVIAKLQNLYDEFVACDKEILKHGLEWLYSDFMRLDRDSEVYRFLIKKWLDLPQNMPVKFKAVPEGSFVANNMPVISIMCVEKKHCWFANFIETYLNSELWKTCFIATKAALFKKIEYDYLSYYLDVSYNFHDFSARGMNGIMDCYTSSIGHLLFFNGTDSIMGVQNVWENYSNCLEEIQDISKEHGLKKDSNFALQEVLREVECSELFKNGDKQTLEKDKEKNKELESSRDFKNTESNYALTPIVDSIKTHNIHSIPASEHSVMCLGGQEGELESFKFIMRRFPHSPVSIVADTWNLWEIIDRLREDSEAYAMIMTRSKPLILRPDSGDPFLILTGDKSATDRRERAGVIRLVSEYFGLDKVKIIYGDAITVERAANIYAWCKEHGFNPTEFLCLGVGSYAFNSGIRDDVGLVTKMTWAKIAGKPVHLLKKPITGRDKISLTGKVGIKKDTREVVQSMDVELEDDLLSQDLRIQNLDSIKRYAKAEFLRVLNFQKV